MSRKFLYVVFPLLILAGIFLRFYNLRYNTQFNWDQENSLAFPAREILVNHHFPLIGPRTGVGDLYLSPFYSYLAALFFGLFQMDPIAGTVLAATLSIITLILGFILVNKVLNFSIAFYFTLIWSVSTFIVSLDRIPWNVNLFPIASLLVFFGLWLSFTEEKTKGWMLTGLGLFLGVNSHFSVLFLFITALIFILLNRKNLDKSIFIAFFLLFLGLLPLILFNFRHQFLLTHNLAKFIAPSVTKIEYIPTRIMEVSAMILGTIGRLIFFDGASWIQQTIAILFLLSLVYLRKDYQMKKFTKIFTLYLLVYSFGFSLYSGSTPQYYFVGLLPIIAIGLSLLFFKIQEKFSKLPLFLAVFFSIILFRSYLMVSQINPQSLGAKQKIISKVKEVANGQPISVAYDMDLGHSFGYNYLFDYYKVRKSAVGRQDYTFWISYPTSRFPGKPDYSFGDIALGFPETSKKIFSTKEIELYSHLLKLRLPKEWVVLQCQGVDFDKYLLTPDTSASCSRYDEVKSGLAVFNWPSCNIWQIDDKVDLNVGSGVPLFITSTEILRHIFPKLSKGYIFVTSPETNRCVGFVDLGSFAQSYPSLTTKDIMVSLRK